MKCQFFLFIILFTFTISTSLLAQDETVLETGYSCGLEVTKVAIPHMLEFTSNSEASEVMNDIMRVVGLRPNFTIQAADVPNAAAVVIGMKRYILYNPKFIKSVHKSTNNNWSAISILAHELGHHLNGHTLSNKGSRPRMELEADEFSGFVLRKLGADLTDAQTAMNLLASPYGSISHPAKGARLDAIKRGWDAADEMIKDYGGGVTAPAENPSSTASEEEYQEKPPVAGTENNKQSQEQPAEINQPIVAKSYPSYAAYYVKLNPNPNSQYFVTNGGEFVLVRGSNIYPLGNIERNYKDENFPNVIRIKRGDDLYIAKGGDLYNKKGTKMGVIKRID